jgi:hypothetical protein
LLKMNICCRRCRPAGRTRPTDVPGTSPYPCWCEKEVTRKHLIVDRARCRPRLRWRPPKLAARQTPAVVAGRMGVSGRMNEILRAALGSPSNALFVEHR